MGYLVIFLNDYQMIQLSSNVMTEGYEGYLMVVLNEPAKNNLGQFWLTFGSRETVAQFC